MTHLRVLLASTLRRDANCIDIGAHSGTVLAEIVRIAPAGRHIAFEPLPAQARSLAARFRCVDVRNAAVSDHVGRAQFFHDVDRPTVSTLLARGAARQDKRIVQLEVDVVSLDSALIEDYVPSLVKIDVEGAEMRVLNGARKTLERHRPMVVFEYSGRWAEAPPEEPFDLLTDLGFRIFDLDGDGPLERRAFRHLFEIGAKCNFMAHP